MKIGTLLLASIFFLAGIVPLRAQTDEQMAMMLEIQSFAQKHSLGPEVDLQSPYAARLQTFGKQYFPDPTNPNSSTAKVAKEWEESGYPTGMGAVKAVEADYFKYPDGHIGVYKAPKAPTSK